MSENGAVILHHPPTDCCEAALRDQIRFRQAEIETLRAAYAEAKQRVDQLLLDAEEAPSRMAETKTLKRHRYAADRLEASMRTYYEPRAVALRGEISTLEREIEKRKRNALPYKDGE